MNIYNWSGSLSGGGTDQLHFGSDANGLTSSQLAQIAFYSGDSTGFLGMTGILSTGEIVPVPEPTTWLGGALAAAAIAYCSVGSYAHEC